MNWIDKLERRWGRYGIPNLMNIILVGQLIAWVIVMVINQNFYYAITLNRTSLMSGQIWRVVTFLFVPPLSTGIQLLLTLYFRWWVGNSLQRAWGDFRFMMYILVGMVGALAALASNFFFGQGPWTPWQMYAWGLVGYGAGLLAAIPAKASNRASKSGHAECGEGRRSRKQPLIERHAVIIYIYGFASCLMYGFILNAWSILSFYHAQASGLAGILLVYATALPFDVAHGVATVVFLAALYAPWRRKLKRIKSKYGME